MNSAVGGEIKRNRCRIACGGHFNPIVQQAQIGWNISRARYGDLLPRIDDQKIAGGLRKGRF